MKQEDDAAESGSTIDDGVDRVYSIILNREVI